MSPLGGHINLIGRHDGQGSRPREIWAQRLVLRSPSRRDGVVIEVSRSENPLGAGEQQG